MKGFNWRYHAAWMLTLGSFTSCGYHHESDTAWVCYQTVSIDPIEGDWNGDLTAALVEQIAACSSIKYHHCGGDTLLHIDLEDPDEKNIGFRYSHHKDGKIRKSIIPTETRLTAAAQVSLIEAATGKTLLGPVKIKASVDFDHDYYTTRHGVNIFSLGQLNDYDEAYDAAYSPLIKALAQKIVEYIVEYW
jgi:hypothetical protein